MSFLNSFDISASGMTAQRQRLDIAAENISNMNTTIIQIVGDHIEERWSYCRKTRRLLFEVNCKVDCSGKRHSSAKRRQ